MSDVAIKVNGLRKAYEQIEAVKGIDLRVFRGEVFALLGPLLARLGQCLQLAVLKNHVNTSIDTSYDPKVIALTYHGPGLWLTGN